MIYTDVQLEGGVIIQDWKNSWFLAQGWSNGLSIQFFIYAAVMAVLMLNETMDHTISAGDIMRSKILLLIVHVIVQGGLFFVLIYIIPTSIHQKLSFVQYFELVWLWFGYALVLGCLYAYMQISLIYRNYLLFSIGWLLLFSGLAYIGWVRGFSIVEHSIYWIGDYGMVITLATLPLCIVCFYVFYRFGVRKIYTRDLLL